MISAFRSHQVISLRSLKLAVKFQCFYDRNFCTFTINYSFHFLEGFSRSNKLIFTVYVDRNKLPSRKTSAKYFDFCTWIYFCFYIRLYVWPFFSYRHFIVFLLSCYTSVHARKQVCRTIALGLHSAKIETSNFINKKPVS